LPYDAFARVYDHFFGPEALPATLEALTPLLLNHLSPGSRILDLCCGTGELTQELVKRGYSVKGIDNSPQMLRLARQRLAQVTFWLADMRNFTVSEQFDAVVCAYNSVPHITSSKDLVRVFESVIRVLNPAGLFVFDLYSEKAYLERWRGSFSQADDDLSCVVRPSYNRSTRIGENEIEIRRHSAMQSKIRLVTRCYSPAELQECLCAAGFISIERFEAQECLHVAQAAGRVFWRCRKP
jgi:SAM-dependent methyltransferase